MADIVKKRFETFASSFAVSVSKVVSHDVTLVVDLEWYFYSEHKYANPIFVYLQRDCC